MARKKKNDDSENYVIVNSWPMPRKDYELFEQMKGHYISEAEQFFFEEMRRREIDWDSYAVLGDLLVCEDDNPDGVRFQRDYDCEFWIDSFDFERNEWIGHNEHYYSLYEVLHNRIAEIGSITLWEWLRQTDYQFVRYDRNYGQ